MSCTREWQAQAIDEARLGAADAAAFERHAQTCGACSRALKELCDLRALAAQLPGREPSELELRRIRGTVLRQAMSPPRPRRVALPLSAAAAAFATAAALYGACVHGPASKAFAATVTAKGGASWTQTREDRVERVVLSEGELTLHVRKQAADERFLVVVPDGEVEVRGTTFEVATHEGATSRVHVDEGIVVVRIHGTSTLAAGATWPRPDAEADSAHRTTSSAPAAEAPAPPIAEPPVASSPVASHAAVPGEARQVAVTMGAHTARKGADLSGARDSSELLDYEQAVTAFRAGRYEDAAERFRTFTVAHASSPLLDDASFLEASSLASAGRGDAAALLAERHLARFPSSFHRRDAAILVARLRRDRGDCDGAREAVGEWLTETPPDPRVVAAVGACATR